MSWEWKESVTEMEGVDGMEIGTSPVLRGEAWQSSSSLDGPPIQSCVCSELLFSLGIRLCVILYLFLLSALCLTLTSSLLSCSVSRYYSPYSVHLGTVTTAAADSPSSWVRSAPPPFLWLHCVEGLLGLISLQMIPFLFETKKGQVSFIYFIFSEVHRRGKKILLSLSYRSLAYDEGFIEHTQV